MTKVLQSRSEDLSPKRVADRLRGVILAETLLSPNYSLVFLLFLYLGSDVPSLSLSTLDAAGEPSLFPLPIDMMEPRPILFMEKFSSGLFEFSFSSFEPTGSGTDDSSMN